MHRVQDFKCRIVQKFDGENTDKWLPIHQIYKPLSFNVSPLKLTINSSSKFCESVSFVKVFPCQNFALYGNFTLQYHHQIWSYIILNLHYYYMALSSTYSYYSVGLSILDKTFAKINVQINS